MVTGVDAATALVLIVKVAVVLAAGTVTLEGTVAAALLLESVTCAPPAGASPLSVTVPVDRSEERRVGEGCNVREEAVGRGGGVTVSEVDVPVPRQDTEIVCGVDSDMWSVVLVKVAVVLAAGTVTLEGTLAAALLLESVTCAPPAGASPLSVTVPVDDCVPPVTLVGFNVSEETVGRGGSITERVTDYVVPS